MSSFFLIRVLPAILLSLFVAVLPHDDGKDIEHSAPAGIGGNGPWALLNTRLMGRLTLTELGSGGAPDVLCNDCWGWTDPISGKEYAICGLTNSTSFVDISDPFNPKYLGSLPTQTGNKACGDMKVFKDHAFVVSDGNGAHGMQVFDLTVLPGVDPQFPQTFSNTAWYGGITNCHNIAINEDSGYAYLVGTNTASGGLHVLNINNPVNPALAGEFSLDGYTHDVQVVIYTGPDPNFAGREIAFCSNEDTVTIVDVTDKNAMVMISRNTYAEDGYTHQGWLSEDQRYFYMGDELDERNFGGPTRLHIFDCLDLQNPTYKGYYSGATHAIDHNLYVHEGRIYSGGYASGLRVLQIGIDPAQLSEVAYFDTFNTNTGVNFNGVWSVYPYFDSDVILVTDRQNGMFLIKLTPLSFAYPTGRPQTIHSEGWQAEFQVQVNAFVGSPQPGTGVLHVDRGNGFESFPMNSVSDNLYQAYFPATPCGSDVKYYVSAMATDGSIVYSPNNAPTDYWSAVSGYSFDTVHTDDFETDQGWTISGNATGGQWNRGIPVGGGLRGDPLTDADGSGSCYITENAAGDSDVDTGNTILMSPLLDATGPGAMDAILSWYRWYSNDVGGTQSEDVFVVDISNDDGSTWVNVDTVGPTGNDISGGWFRNSFRIGDFVVPTNQMRVRFDVSDLGNGSVVEAGIDWMEIQLIDCLQTITPLIARIWDGVPLSGSIVDITTSNNVYWRFDPDPTINLRKQVVDLIFQSEVPGLLPTELRLKLEARINGGPAAEVVQRSYLFNYLTRRYELIESRPASNSDNLIDLKVGGDVSRFVNPIGEITARVKWTSPKFTGPPFSWTVDIDQLEWRYSEAPSLAFDPSIPSFSPVDSGKTIRKKSGSR